MEIDNEPIVLYWYKDNTGVRRYTPNSIFARARAEFFGTNDVYIETVK